MKGTLFTLAGLAEGLAGTKEGKEGTERRQLRITDTDGGISQLGRAVLKGRGSSRKGQQLVEHTGRLGQLACPEDMLEQLCRLPKAIWRTRTYLAHQITIMSACLP